MLKAHVISWRDWSRKQWIRWACHDGGCLHQPAEPAVGRRRRYVADRHAWYRQAQKPRGRQHAKRRPRDAAQRALSVGLQPRQIKSECTRPGGEYARKCACHLPALSIPTNVHARAVAPGALLCAARDFHARTASSKAHWHAVQVAHAAVDRHLLPCQPSVPIRRPPPSPLTDAPPAGCCVAAAGVRVI
eukprot:365041-Chlamydomonas_euryale.AAC.9